MNEIEKAVSDFIDYCNGEIEDYIQLDSKIERVEMQAYGDMIYYKDGSKEFISIGD